MDDSVVHDINRGCVNHEYSYGNGIVESSMD